MVREVHRVGSNVVNLVIIGRKKRKAVASDWKVNSRGMCFQGCTFSRVSRKALLCSLNFRKKGDSLSKRDWGEKAKAKIERAYILMT